MEKKIQSKSKNKWIIIDLLAVPSIIILTIILVIKSGSVENELSIFQGNAPIESFIIALLFCTVPKLVRNLVIYFAITIIIRKKEKSNLTYNTTTDINYFREPLKKLSPFDISILANLSIEDNKDIAATILWYQNKGYISIKDNQIIYNNNINYSEKDKLFLNYLNTKNKEYLNQYKTTTYNKLLENNIIEENKYFDNISKIFIKNFLTLCILYILIISLILVNVFIIQNTITKTLILIFIIIISLFITYKKVSTIIKIYINRKYKYIRTKQGNEITTYVHALQNFIHDFSNLKDASKEQIVLWNDFLVYAIVLEENTKIIDNILNTANNSHSITSLTAILEYAKQEL